MDKIEGAMSSLLIAVAGLMTIIAVTIFQIYTKGEINERECKML